MSLYLLPCPRVQRIDEHGAEIIVAEDSHRLTWQELSDGSETDPLGFTQGKPEAAAQWYRTALDHARRAAWASRKRMLAVVRVDPAGVWDVTISYVNGDLCSSHGPYGTEVAARTYARTLWYLLNHRYDFEGWSDQSYGSSMPLASPEAPGFGPRG